MSIPLLFADELLQRYANIEATFEDVPTRDLCEQLHCLLVVRRSFMPHIGFGAYQLMEQMTEVLTDMVVSRATTGDHLTARQGAQFRPDKVKMRELMIAHGDRICRAQSDSALIDALATLLAQAHTEDV